MNNNIQEKLKTLGLKAKFVHLRKGETKGGVTIAILEKGKTRRKEVARGYARCSDLDNFCKERGRELALERAIFSLANPDYAAPKLNGSTTKFFQELQQYS